MSGYSDETEPETVATASVSNVNDARNASPTENVLLTDAGTEFS